MVTLLVFWSSLKWLIKALFILKHRSVDKYFIRSSVESEVKSQVVTVPKYQHKDPFSSKPSCRGEELTVTSWGKYCCGPRHSFDLNTTAVKLNSPCASWEVLDSYSTSVCCWRKEPTNSPKTEIYFLKNKKKYVNYSKWCKAAFLAQVLGLWLAPWVLSVGHQNQSLAKGLCQTTVLWYTSIFSPMIFHPHSDGHCEDETQVSTQLPWYNHDTR